MKLEYPEHEKLKALEGKNQDIGLFLEWLQSSFVIAEEYDDEDRLLATHKTIPDLLAMYFKIDQRKLEDEKDAMLKSIRGE